MDSNCLHAMQPFLLFICLEFAKLTHSILIFIWVVSVFHFLEHFSSLIWCFSCFKEISGLISA